MAERKIYRHQLLGALFNQRKFRTLSPLEVQEFDFYAGQARGRYLIRRLFQGTLESTLRCEVCSHTSPNRETFLDISLPVAAAPPASSYAGAKASAIASTPSVCAVGPAYSGQYARQKSPDAAPAMTKRKLKKELRKGNNKQSAAAKAAAAREADEAEKKDNNKNNNGTSISRKDDSGGGGSGNSGSEAEAEAEASDISSSEQLDGKDGRFLQLLERV